MINIPIYRDVNIYKICGGDKEKEFEELNSPFYRILATQSKLTNKNEDIRLCLIDDTFLRFIEANELEINKNSIATFINSLSDLEVKLLWDKYENNTSIDMFIFPFMSIKEDIEENTYLNLDDTQKKLLINLAKEVFELDEKDFFVPGYVLSFEKMIKDGDSLLGVGESFLLDGKPITYKIMETQKNNKDCNIFLFCIPIFVKRKINYKVKCNIIKDYLNPFKKSFNEINIDLNKIIYFEGYKNLPLVDNFLYKEELPEVYKEVEDLVEKQTKKITGIKGFFNRLFNKNKRD